MLVQELLEKDFPRFTFKDLLEFNEYLRSKERIQRLMVSHPVDFWSVVDKVTDDDVDGFFDKLKDVDSHGGR